MNPIRWLRSKWFDHRFRSAHPRHRHYVETVKGGDWDDPEIWRHGQPPHKGSHTRVNHSLNVPSLDERIN